MSDKPSSPARFGTVTTSSAYLAAVAILTWETINNHLGDQIYGRLVMAVLSFPISLIDWFAGDAVFAVLRDASHSTTAGWEYVALGWPGVITAGALTVLMTLSRTQTFGRTFGWFLTVMTLASGLMIAFDAWAPRRPWGWPVVVCALIMAAGLMLSRRRSPA
ncbi:hypothetical protein ACQPYK_50410 (plasmid) [Streptosporangium sp. CA-135522]|uniref:hypothetical protein n=1 Tax=Streptosporangium sp. CA-135522 TaxID=3240072 RepID=UPI003D92F156